MSPPSRRRSSASATSARRSSATRASAPVPEMGLMIATTFTIHCYSTVAARDEPRETFMRSRALRVALHALFLAGLVAAAYQVWQKESAAVAAVNAAQAFDERARAVERSLLEVKGAQGGYVGG